MEPAPPPRRGDPLIVAHRGVWGEAPQNSLAALQAAIELGCDMVEVDVRRTRDGQLVTIHDPRVGGTPVGALDYDELRAKVAPDEVPRLTDFLESAAAGGMALDVELKEEGYEELVAATLAERLPATDYVVTSFLPMALAAVRGVAPGVRTGLLLRPGPVSRTLERRLHDSRADFLAPNVRLARPTLLSWIAEHGLECFVWTVNHRRAMRTMLDDPRVTAVITDRPAEALGLRRGARSRERAEHDHAGDHESHA
jgi:glycerophosphoryl diester phosphodiesterase